MSIPFVCVAFGSRALGVKGASRALRLAAGAIIVPAMVLGGSMAQAGVATGVVIDGTSGEQSVRAYNPAQAYGIPGPQQGVIGDTGIYTCHPLYCSPAFPGAVSTGSTDTTGALTSSFDTLSGDYAADASSASASASANLANGTLHETVSGAFGYVYGGEDQYSEGVAGASIFDTLTFDIAGANASTVTDITLNYKIDGAVSGLLFHGFENAALNYQISLGNTQVSQSAYWGPGVPGTPAFAYGALNENFGGSPVSLQSVIAIEDSPTLTELSITYALTGSSITTGFYDGLSIGCGDGVTCDYADTSAVSFVLPSDVTLSSASGKFLTAGVPEPKAWALMISGLLLVGGAARHARRSATMSA
jgi:hypothetical protein